MDNRLFDLITFHNPLEIPFKITYNNEIVRTIPANTTVQMVRMWADAGKKDLVDILMRRDKVNLLNKEKRAEYEKQVILGEEGSLLGVAPTTNQLADQLLKQAENAKNPVNNQQLWKFDPLTGKPLQAEQVMPQPDPTPETISSKPVFTNPEVANVMSNISTGTGSLPAQDLTKEEEVVNIQPKEPETKEQLEQWIRANLPVNMDDATTKEKYNAMTLEEAIKEFKYRELA